jgi:hypothetical protein
VGEGGQMRMIADKVGGWGWQIVDVSKKRYISSLLLQKQHWQFSLNLFTKNVLSEGGGWFKKAPKPPHIKYKDGP